MMKDMAIQDVGMPEEVGLWAHQHHDVLQVVWERYDAEGRWPDAARLTRDRFAIVPRRDFLAIGRQIPPALGCLRLITDGPDVNQQVIALTPRGLWFVDDARPLLTDFARLIRLGVERYANPANEAIVSTADMETCLELNKGRVRQLEDAAMLDSWLLRPNGGQPGNMRFAVDDHAALQVADVVDFADYLRAQAEAWWPAAAQAESQPLPRVDLAPDPTAQESEAARGRRVMVVHGRNLKARDAMFRFLRSVELAPIPWHQAVSETGMGSPHNLAAVRAAMDVAQAVVVILTPEERAGLLPELASPDDTGEVQIRTQPRQNVILEAGMAMGVDQEHTILVELGSVREASDLAGLNRVRLDNTPARRNEFLKRLERIGCEVVDTAEYFDTAHSGDFESCVVKPPSIQVGNVSQAGQSAAMVSRDPDHLEIFWVGPNSEVRYRWWLRQQGWSRIESMSEPKTQQLAAVRRETGDEILFGLTPDGLVWYRAWESGEEGWPVAGKVQWLDSVVQGPLTVASRTPDTIELFAFDLNGRPCHRWTEGGLKWAPWTSDW
ncbi:MAG: TIR domain-containing protein [Solirubrobacteraceae bacterium]|jgi:predicted nucleotide-binding protein